eukprot:Gb_04698 [translate_table: standard]
MPRAIADTSNFMLHMPNDGSSSRDKLMAILNSCQLPSLKGFEEARARAPAMPKRPFYGMFDHHEDVMEDKMADCNSNHSHGLHHVEKKRRLTADQVRSLELSFEMENKLEPERKMKLAEQLGLQPRQVAVWFQNRRARWKTKELERVYDALKVDFDTVLAEKEKLQAEVKMLTAKLEAKNNGLEEFKTSTDNNMEDSQTVQQTDSLSVEEEKLIQSESTDEVSNKLKDLSPCSDVSDNGDASEQPPHAASSTKAIIDSDCNTDFIENSFSIDEPAPDIDQHPQFLSEFLNSSKLDEYNCSYINADYPWEYSRIWFSGDYSAPIGLECIASERRAKPIGLAVAPPGLRTRGLRPPLYGQGKSSSKISSNLDAVPSDFNLYHSTQCGHSMRFTTGPEKEIPNSLEDWACERTHEVGLGASNVLLVGLSQAKASWGTPKRQSIRRRAQGEDHHAPSATPTSSSNAASSAYTTGRSLSGGPPSSHPKMTDRLDYHHPGIRTCVISPPLFVNSKGTRALSCVHIQSSTASSNFSLPIPFFGFLYDTLCPGAARNIKTLHGDAPGVKYSAFDTTEMCSSIAITNTWRPLTRRNSIFFSPSSAPLPRYDGDDYWKIQAGFSATVLTGALLHRLGLSIPVEM